MFLRVAYSQESNRSFPFLSTRRIYGFLFELIVIRFLYVLVTYRIERRIKIMKEYSIVRKEWIMLLRPCLLVLCFCTSTSSFIVILYNDDFLYNSYFFLFSTHCRLHRIYIVRRTYVSTKYFSYI